MSRLKTNPLPTFHRPLLIEFGFFFNLGSWKICKSRKEVEKISSNGNSYYVIFNSIEEIKGSTPQFYWKFKSFRNQIISYLVHVKELQIANDQSLNIIQLFNAPFKNEFTDINKAS